MSVTILPTLAAVVSVFEEARKNFSSEDFVDFLSFVENEAKLYKEYIRLNELERNQCITSTDTSIKPTTNS